ncbi:hypothetical protein BDA96_04G207600 [Sorghum bicolor]|uniref:Uncharacterized protein n=1 Tax=Sorghum bicolor TaxID=4558 RepID=A0A921R5R5_SORBI|nr:hypothetical protein BDA96_04G207600 [Sorghum bicolor]
MHVITLLLHVRRGINLHVADRLVHHPSTTVRSISSSKPLRTYWNSSGSEQAAEVRSDVLSRQYLAIFALLATQLTSLTQEEATRGTVETEHRILMANNAVQCKASILGFHYKTKRGVAAPVWSACP